MKRFSVRRYLDLGPESGVVRRGLRHESRGVGAEVQGPVRGRSPPFSVRPQILVRPQSHRVGHNKISGKTVSTIQYEEVLVVEPETTKNEGCQTGRQGGLVLSVH